MLGPNRRNIILQLLREHGQILVKETAKKLKVSEGTLRNDLKLLEEEGFLIKTHGGAVLPIPHGRELSFESRVELNSDEKRGIGAACLPLLEGKNCIIIDASSTGLELAKQLISHDNLTVITNGLDTAQLLSKNPKINVIIIGGVVRSGSSEVEGVLGKTMLSQLHADILFTSSYGLTPEHGMTDFSIYESELKKIMVGSADKVVALMDHTKLGRRSIATSIQMPKIDILITSQLADKALLNEFIEKNSSLEVIVAPPVTP